ncbi:MAG: thiamine biosynthesis protein ThiS [Omnitrophica WOR_2 bacterium GWF2_43_52]|nr:MAG: thiamine biosynthesis protein ThiS [Omnitrophica WOR_2 bacterium GWA2_44_7]OGX16647.1 MAG: thiamine biosynthesis protein ThiS [Omnitrophica WOR_2 bacterium GWC2_44_8]OGX22682.1 MAG: thiamine biosynthesis protein ThiS [Omnitrophica WOR_2 bacterium GWF2_43_52]OGX57845.1 MAG: thiamine biosynthesis protein ThiS [Omnitrophica WOR_2 bacterium RIFOXYC2_FULL_43_9]
MKVRINGEDVFLPQGVSLSAIITERKINAQAVVVEYNGVILTREKWKPVVLKENDTLEIVSFVGGG